ncbi:MAG: hypothetical protein CMQ19_13820 [Gammaproteobacteria bacterium]|nr:hypothetical protein [Gammaproteobacteria bacterium]|tara:strand:+ start:2948 stop:3388 length:441 start_codon:yes stop_codon:yes gene_type:complete
MNIRRFQQLLDAYGTREKNWPAEEREAARALLNSDAECASLVQQYQSLDEHLDEYVTRMPPGLGQRILSQLPAPLIDRIIGWLIPDVSSQIWQPAIAGSLLLILGMIIGASMMGSFLDDAGSESNWDEEIYLFALDDTSLIGLNDE